MAELEKNILRNFKRYMGAEVEGLDLFVAFCDDCWPNDEGDYTCEVMERQDNGKVWACICSKSGTIKDTYEV